MKSIRQYFNARRALMITAYLLYVLSFFLFELMFFLPMATLATLFVALSVALMAAALCSFYAHKQKDYLFCPKCGSSQLIETSLFCIPVKLHDVCPDCGKKIDLEKPVNQD